MSEQSPRRAQYSHVFAVRGVRLALAAVAVAVGASAALAWAAQRYAATMQQEVAQLRVERDGQRARLQREGGPQAVERFERLRTQGLFATGDAVAWVEALNATVAELGLPPPRFEVAARQSAATAEEQGEGPAYFVQQMRFSVDGLHEDEFLRLLARLARRAPGPFAVRECRLARAADDQGLSAECTLRWVVFAPPQGRAGAAGSAPS